MVERGLDQLDGIGSARQPAVPPVFAPHASSHSSPPLALLLLLFAGGGALGHPKIFINLDKSHERPQACSYW